MTELTPKAEKRLTGWHVILWFAAFFGLIFAVNGVFLYSAIESFPGEDTPKSYIQGINYNDALQARSAQKKLGWRAEMGAVNNELQIRMIQKDGTPLTGLVIVGGVRHSAATSHDQSLVFRSMGKGLYAADISELQAGSWEAFASVVDEANETIMFTAHKDILLP